MDDISLEKYIDTRLQAIEKSIDVAALRMETRLDGLNEWRQQSKDQAARVPSREEVELMISRVQTAQNRIIDDIRELQDFKAMLSGKASQQSANIALVVAFTGTMISVISIIIRLVGK